MTELQTDLHGGWDTEPSRPRPAAVPGVSGIPCTFKLGDIFKGQ